MSIAPDIMGLNASRVSRSLLDTGPGDRAMFATALTSTPLSPAEIARQTAKEDFSNLLGRASTVLRQKKELTAQQIMAKGTAEAREAAESFVSIALLQPILKNLRSASIGKELPPPWGPGPGEKQFRGLADQQVARQMVRSSNWPVVNRIAKDLGKAALRLAGQEPSIDVEPGSPADIKRLAQIKAAAEQQNKTLESTR